MKVLKELYKILQKVLIPPKLYHWKVPLLVSLCLWLSALLTQDSEWRNYLANLSWIFLIVAIGWGTTQPPFLINGISLSPWITGALISVFLSGTLTRDHQPFAIISWPLVSACLATLLEFKISRLNFEISFPLVRPTFLIFILIHALLSCWLGYYFMIQTWLENYPSILAEDLNRSGFVISTKPKSINNSRGILLIKLMEAYLINKTNNRPWIAVENWLFDVSNQRLDLATEALKKLPKLPEDSLWELKTLLVQGESHYRVKLIANWQGPSSNHEGYLLTKSCEINKFGTQSQIECSPIKAAKAQSK
ncbi:MAG: DUF5357 family protein [Actinomycetota bacterium]